MFKIGDKVLRTRLGVQSTGVIYGIADAKTFRRMLEKAEHSLRLWDLVFPNWEEKPVYYLELPEPMPSISLNDVRMYNKGKTTAEIQELYNKLPKFPCVACPEEDLVKI